jgi:DNA repair protein RecO (recombination protein O)
MEERTSGIILRTRPLTETSLIVQWLTPELGRIFTVAKGARRPKSPFLGKLDIFYEAELSFARSRRSELHNLREVIIRNSNAHLREEMGWLKQAAYFAVLIEKSTESEAPIPELHELLKQALAHLPTQPANAATTFVFELKLLCALGYEPRFGSLSEPARIAGESAMTDSFEKAAARLTLLEERCKQELNRFLHRAIGTALEKVPPQREGALAYPRGSSDG